ncbi:hypothetical protein JCM9279_005802 [Rhodotorula babjevae]
MAHSLSRWLAQHGVWLDPRVHLESTPGPTASSSSPPSTSVALAHARRAPRATVARIPLDLVLSHRSSSLAAVLDDRAADALAAHAPALRLAVHVAHELASGSRSRWATYLELCPPREAVPIALLWNGEARRWTRGTELLKECDRIGINEAVLERFYNDVALPLLSSLPSTSLASLPSLSTVLDAYTLVASRAFQVSSFHPLALVPLADAFNHWDPPHVHLASDAWVCPECGTLGACVHDDEGEPERERESALGPPRTSSARDEAETVDMVCERDVEPGEEVYNTYGGALSNAHLVAAYGFLLEGNEHDVVSFERRSALETLVRLVDAAGGHPCSAEQLVPELDELEAASQTALNGNLLIAVDHPLIAPFPPPTSSSPASLDLVIDADARISTSLWLAVALVAQHAAARTVPSSPERDYEQRAAKEARAASPSTGRGAKRALQGAVRLAELAGEAWQAAEEAAEDGDPGPVGASADGGGPSAQERVLEREELRWASVLVRGLCAARVEEQVEEARELDASALYGRAEEVDDPSLRLAIEFLAGERLLIERIVSQWTFA